MSTTPGLLPLAYEQKIHPRHLERLAVVYVRQSTVHQVHRHRESTQVQYSLVGLAERLQWPRERILVIDDDLGVSGASVEGRHGFQRLLSEVALEHVGLILGVEMSRLARSCKDWYQLLEMCALFGTLICDLDGLYDPSSYNDRLLLGLKGTMSEAELHILQQRMQQGALQKARRGELVTKVPTGYVRTNGQVAFDPDEQVRTFVSTVFTLFERCGSLSAVLRYLVQQGLQMPIRLQDGPDKGTLHMRRPYQAAIRNILRHPMYTGAYVYGRTVIKKKSNGRPRKHLRSNRDEWTVLLRDRYPAYITWAQYERNLAQLEANRTSSQSPGAVRSGSALVTGLIVCGRCGARMGTAYGGKQKVPRYVCLVARNAYGASACQHLAAREVDHEVARLAMQALAPAALEVSLRVAADLQQQLDQAQSLWQQRLERAQYEVDRARRQYEAVEPENRLVARTLEAAWEEKLRAQRALQEEQERFLQRQPRLLTTAEQEQIRGLAADLPALWQAPTTTDADRKAILRQLIDKVVVTVEGETEWSEARIYWAGGHETYTRFRRPVACFEQLSTWPQIRQTILTLKEEGSTARTIADQLNSKGYRSASGKPFTQGGVRVCLYRYSLSKLQRHRIKEDVALAPDEWYVTDLVRELGVCSETLYEWIRKGRLEARQVGGCQGLWIIRADTVAVKQLQTHVRLRSERQSGNRSPSPIKAKQKDQ